MPELMALEQQSDVMVSTIKMPEMVERRPR